VRDGVNHGPAQRRPGLGKTVDRVHYLCPRPLIKRVDPGQQLVGDPDLSFVGSHKCSKSFTWQHTTA
jgi:hypothetical protein